MKKIKKYILDDCQNEVKVNKNFNILKIIQDDINCIYGLDLT